jgi:predicted enzyme related to lactoylglutathione lyase
MDASERLTSIGQPVPELPVADVERAQQYYRDVFAFDIRWLAPDKTIGAVSRGDAAIFFRQRNIPFEPAVHWIFAPDIDATYREFKSSGANIINPLEKKPWGLRQFTVQDLDGNLFYVHCDLKNLRLACSLPHVPNCLGNPRLFPASLLPCAFLHLPSQPQWLPASLSHPSQPRSDPALTPPTSSRRR